MILIGTDGGIYRWFEGCGWPIFHSLQDRSIVGLAAPGLGVLVALDRGGTILESVDNGLEWRQIPLPAGAGSPAALAVGGSPATIVLATAAPGLYCRALGAPVPRMEEAPAERGFAPALIGRARTLARSATGRTSTRTRPASGAPDPAEMAGWTRLTPPGVDSRGIAPTVRMLAPGAGSPAPWYAADRGGGLWRSDDAGMSWQRCEGLTAGVLAVRTAPKAPGRVYAATANGCWFSGDGGQTWEERSGGLEKSRYVAAIAVKPDEPDVLLAGAAPRGPDEAAAASPDGLGFSLFESNNGGKTWSLVRRGNPDVLDHDTITDIRYDPVAPDNIVMALASGELWLSRNGGAYWSPLARQIRAARVLDAV